MADQSETRPALPAEFDWPGWIARVRQAKSTEELTALALEMPLPPESPPR